MDLDTVRPDHGEVWLMAAGHAHGVPPQAPGPASRRHLSRLWAALALVLAVMLVEAVAAWWTGSLALLSDAGHLATDALGIGMALAAIHAASRAGRGNQQRTFGLYRLEVLAALANAALLFAVAGFVLVEAVRRLAGPPQILATPMLVVAAGGLVANLVALGLLRHGAKESLNLRGAYLEVLGDLLSSVGVVIAAVIILLTDWWYADPVLAIAVALFILPRTFALGRAALRVLVQAAPSGVAVGEVAAALASLPGVRDVHDLHVWTLTSGMDVASAHLTIDTPDDLGKVLSAARDTLRERYGIEHATMQVEPSTSGPCRHAGW